MREGNARLLLSARRKIDQLKRWGPAAAALIVSLPACFMCLAFHELNGCRVDTVHQARLPCTRAAQPGVAGRPHRGLRQLARAACHAHATTASLARGPLLDPRLSCSNKQTFHPRVLGSAMRHGP